MGVAAKGVGHWGGGVDSTAAYNFRLLLTPGQYAVNLPECASRFGNAAADDDEDGAAARNRARTSIVWQLTRLALLEMGYIFYA